MRNDHSEGGAALQADRRRLGGGRKRRDSSLHWMLLSLLLHAGALGLALFIKPVREAVFGRATEPHAPAPVGGAQLAEIAGKVVEANARELRSATRELAGIRDMLDTLRAEKLAEYAAQASVDAVSAPAHALAQLDRALAAQARASDALAQAAGAPDQAAAPLDTARTAQSEAQVFQQEARQRLEVASPALPSALAAQHEAAQRQAEAMQRQAAAQAALHEARQSSQVEQELTHLREALAREAAALQKAAETLAAREAAASALQPQVVAASNATTQLEAALKEAEQQRDARWAEARQIGNREERRPLETVAHAAGRAADDARSAYYRAKKEEKSLRWQAVLAEDARRNAQRDQDRARSTHDARLLAIADAERRVAAQAQAHQEALQRLQSEQAQALTAQQAAIDAQQQARETLAQAMRASPPAAPTPPTPDAAPATPAVAPRPALALDGMDMPALYDQARLLEADIAAAYKDIRATDLAMLTQRTREQTLAQADVPTPQRREIDPELFRRTVTASDAFERQREQIEIARRETASMLQTAENIQDAVKALRRRSAHGAGVDLEGIAHAAALNQAISSASHEEQGGKVADLSRLMRGQRDAPPGDGSPASPSARTAGPPSPPPPQLVQNPGELRAARKLRGGAAGAAGWTYVDSWYTIGPFPNPNRVNIHRQFPPESVIDLDAVYIGKDGRPLRWLFVQSPDVAVVPANSEEYGIWYAYSEIMSDTARDVWLAVGSDDRSDIWINGLRVWSSSDQLKVWSFGEGLRRVHVNPGRNRILYRLENGWHTMAFSLAMHPATP